MQIYRYRIFVQRQHLRAEHYFLKFDMTRCILADRGVEGDRDVSHPGLVRPQNVCQNGS